jgi:hypothetical protein
MKLSPTPSDWIFTVHRILDKCNAFVNEGVAYISTTDIVKLNPARDRSIDTTLIFGSGMYETVKLKRFRNPSLTYWAAYHGYINIPITSSNTFRIHEYYKVKDVVDCIKEYNYNFPIDAVNCLKTFTHMDRCQTNATLRMFWKSAQDRFKKCTRRLLIPSLHIKFDVIVTQSRYPPADRPSKDIIEYTIAKYTAARKDMTGIMNKRNAEDMDNVDQVILGKRQKDNIKHEPLSVDNELEEFALEEFAFMCADQ